VPEYLENEELKSLNLIQRLVSYSFLINYNILNKVSNKLIVFSNFLKTEYINKGFDSKNIIVQPNLTDLSGWYSPQKVEYLIGYAGTPSIKDGIIDLLYAVKLLKEKECFIKTLIVGDSTSSASLIPYFKKKCEEFDIIQQVTFTGLVSHEKIKEYLNRCQILAVTRPDTKQTRAGFPTKLGEYMACKKVVLATKFGDIENYFNDKSEIVLAEPSNPSSIAENILWILNNSEKSITIAKNGFEKANMVLDYNIGVKRIMNFLN
jgi:glycosyltransferase involved in cell wall biosynthesis